MKIISCAIHKGGTGKTTVAVHLAHHLTKFGKVLMVDCDTQGNATQVFVDVDDPDVRGVSRLFHKKPGKLDLHVAEDSGVLVLPADEDLTDIDSFQNGEEYLFRDNLRKLAEANNIDYVVIDTPPTLNMGMLAPLVASDFAFSPFKPDPFGYRGIRSLIKRIDQIKVKHNPNLQYLGLLINLYNRRNKDQTEIVEAMDEGLSDFLIPHKIGDRSAIARVAFTRTPVWSHNTGAARIATKEMRGALSWITKKMES